MLSSSNVSATPKVLEAYYQELENFSLAPLWLAQETALTDEPTSKALPHIWRWGTWSPRPCRLAT